MSIRLNKVITMLNIGVDTIYNFLRGKPELGLAENLTLNSKITDEQYNALKEKYQRDGAIKEKADNIFSKISERKKQKASEENTLGLKGFEEIDLNNRNQPTEKKRIEFKQTTPNVSTNENLIKVSLGELDFIKHQIVYWSNGIKFVLLNKHISAKFDKYRPDFEKIETTIQLDFQNGHFTFVESNLLPSLIQTFQDKEREQKEKKHKEKCSNVITKSKKIEKTTSDIKLSIPLSNIRFSGNLAIVVYNGKSYSSHVTKKIKIQLLSLNRTQIIPIIIRTTGKTFKFRVNISELIEKVGLQKQPANLKPLQQQKTALGIENIEFQDNYYLIWLIRQGKKDTSITPLRIADSNSLHCLRLIHKYFSDRFPKGIEIVYDNQRVIRLTQAYTLGSYIKVLHANINEHGEWWEDIQNDHKPLLSACKKTPVTQIYKEISLRNCYLDYLAGMPNQKTAIKIYEVRQNQQEDVFVFTITIEDDYYAIIFENVSFTSTATWVFIVKEDFYEECINMIFDYFTNYKLHNKRQSLIKSLNPPQNFKAEQYYKIMHNDPKGWIKHLNGILDRKIPSNKIQFNQGLHVAEEIESRSGSEKTEVQHLHNDLMRKLYYHLCLQYGEENVGTENHIGTKKIDIVVKTEGGYNIYEIKTDKDPRGCVREAMGQILDYAFFECEDFIHKMVIVGVTPETKEVKTYLTKFRKNNSLEIYYTTV